ncbi:MAG: hypothetical protein ACJ8DJ_23800 [Gemmatimonadales bacterium]
MAGLACALAFAAQAAAAQAVATIDPCSLATNEEFQRAYGVDPRIGIIPSTPELTQMNWGPHCDFSDGSIDLFTTKSPGAELDRVLGLMEASKQRTPVSELGKRAFFTEIYPSDKYRHRGLLAIDTGSHLLAISMDVREGEPGGTTRPKLESLAKQVLPRLK